MGVIISCKYVLQHAILTYLKVNSKTDWHTLYLIHISNMGLLMADWVPCLSLSPSKMQIPVIYSLRDDSHNLASFYYVPSSLCHLVRAEFDLPCSGPTFPVLGLVLVSPLVVATLSSSFSHSIGREPIQTGPERETKKSVTLPVSVPSQGRNLRQKSDLISGES